MTDSSSTSSDCQELKNIQYKTLLMSGTNNLAGGTTYAAGSTPAALDQFLTQESKIVKQESWARLDRSARVVKLHEYALVFGEKNGLDAAAVDLLKRYLVTCLNRRRLRNSKDVRYDKELGKIESLPGLLFNKTTRKFTLKRAEGRASTLASLGPGKTRRKQKKIEEGTKDDKGL